VAEKARKPRSGNRSPTLRDVALAAGVSKACAGFALQGLDKVRPATRTRVERAARDLGYVPNMAAALLAKGRHDPTRAVRPAIALLFFDPNFRAGKHTSNIFQLGLIERVAQELGLVLHLEDLSQARDMSAVYRRLKTRGVRGLLIHQNPGVSDRLGEVPEYFATLALDHTPSCPERSRPRVAPDFSSLVIEAWARARAYGYKRPGFALFRHRPTSLDDHLMHGAASACVRELPSAQRIPFLETPHGDRPAVEAWFRLHHPDVVIAMHDGVYWWLRDAGYPSPERIGFISLFLGMDTSIVGKLSGFETDYGALVRHAMLVLAEMMSRADHGHASPSIWSFLPSRWQTGQTLRRQNQRADSPASTP
jgi:DNA-binding LacI/PurR family transcriptional regulator